MENETNKKMNEEIKLLRELFVLREDCYALGYVKKDGKKAFMCKREKLTDEILNLHLSGKKNIGVYQLDLNNKVKWGCLDFDKDTEEDKKQALKIYNHLVNKNFHPLLEKSGGGKNGFKAHIWIFSKTPIPAERMKIFLEVVCKEAGASPNEIFPKQISITSKDFGNLVKLPLGIHPETKRRSELVETNLEFHSNNKDDIPQNIDLSVKKTKVNPFLLEDIPPKKFDDFFKLGILKTNLPEGKVYDIILKNMAIWLYKRDYTEDDIKEYIQPIYKEKKWNFENLLSWYKNVESGSFGDYISLKELIDWCEENQPEFIKYLPVSKNIKKKITSDIKENISNPSEVFGRRGQIEQFWKTQPFFYDKSKMFWLWDKQNKKWINSDEVDVINSIQETLGIETIDSKARGELIAGFQQVGRKHQPKQIKRTWVQFKERVYDVITGESFPASPDYFITNPIPHNVGTSEETPTIDKLLIEWVGEEHKQELYEILFYAITTDRFMQRIFALCGGGSNGKGTFIKLLYRLLGLENCASTELKQLSENQFETAVVFKKLVAIMGEVSYDDLRNTNTIKQMSGEDRMRFCFKNKMPFTDDNTALAISSTNSLPTTPDKSLGFFRRWKIIDFPNQFPQVSRDLISEIPEKEFENLALKCLNGLKKLYEVKKFTNEGDFEERMNRYEERSNPVIRYVEQYCEETEGVNTPLKEFANKCNEYLKSKHLRILSVIQIGKKLREEGFTIGNVKTGETSVSSIKNFRILGISRISQSSILSYKETIEKSDISNILDIPIIKPGGSE